MEAGRGLRVNASGARDMLARPARGRLLIASGRILVTGANGHLGRRLLRRLAGACGVRAAVRSERAAEAVRAAGAEPAPEVVVLDYGDAERLAAAARGCTHAVHLVGILKEGRASRYADAHEASCAALARAADAAGLRRIVYPSILGSRPDAANACLASKGRAEQILLAAKTPAVVLRLPMVLGEGDFAARSIRREAEASVALLVRGGASLEQPIYAGDVVLAIERALEAPGLDDAALDLAGPESLAHRALVERAGGLLVCRPRVVPLPRALAMAGAWLAERLLADPPLTRAMLGVLDGDDRVDPSEACRRLGIELTPLDEVLRRTVARGGAA
jgi:NADH dehydrogenase